MDGWGPCKKEEILYQLVHNVGKIRWEIRNTSYCRPTLTTRYMYCTYIQQISSTPICYDVSVR